MSRDIFIIDLFGLEMFLPAVIKPYWRIEGVNSKLYAIPTQQLEVNGLLNTRGVEWSASCCGCFTARGTHLAGSWVRLRSNLEVLVRRDVLAPAENRNSAIQPVSSP